jgi:sirohydrochlorin ferrochelatase
MLLGALLDLGLALDDLRAELAGLGLAGWELTTRRESRASIVGTLAVVESSPEGAHRRLADIRGILAASTLSERVRARSLAVFTLLAEAEGRVHGTAAGEVMFHEVGGVDAMVDVVGFVCGLELLGVDRVFASPLPLGSGWVSAHHGWLPVPAPAVVELLAAAQAPITADDTPAELVTPTGAAILAGLATFSRPPMRLSRAGYGLGAAHLDRPNALRAWLGELVERGAARPTPPPQAEAIVLLAHGSRDPEGNDEFLAFARGLSERLRRPVRAGFLELAAPSVLDALDEVAAAGATSILAIPWLLVAAGHAKNDLPAAIREFRDHHPGIAVRYGVPLSIRAELLQVLGDRLAEVDPGCGRGSPDSALLVVQRGSSDPDANADVHRAARLLWEGRDFRTVEVAFSGVTRPTLEEGMDRCLSSGVSRIVVLPYFLNTGVLVKRIATAAAAAAAAHPDREFRVARHLGQDARLEVLAANLIDEVREGRAAMTCDCCQYRFPLFGREGRVGMVPITNHTHGLRRSGQ